MNRLKEIYRELEVIRDREATRLFRLCRKALERGCSEELCCKIRIEAWRVLRMQPEHLLDPFNKWEFAFNLWRDF